MRRVMVALLLLVCLVLLSGCMGCIPACNRDCKRAVGSDAAAYALCKANCEMLCEVKRVEEAR